MFKDNIVYFLFIFKTPVLQFLNQVTESVQGLPISNACKEARDNRTSPLSKANIFLHVIYMASNDFPSPA